MSMTTGSETTSSGGPSCIFSPRCSITRRSVTVGDDLQVVLDNQQRNPFLTDPAHELDHAGEAALIEPAHDFIHEQEPRPRGERTGELEPLALAGAETVRNRVHAVG